MRFNVLRCQAEAATGEFPGMTCEYISRLAVNSGSVLPLMIDRSDGGVKQLLDR